MAPSLVILQHVSFETPGFISQWAENNDVRYSVIKLDLGVPLPPISKETIIIVLGGPMSVHDDSLFPWLSAEKEYLRRAISQDVPILGICLGAQLLALTLGATVSRSPYKEIGWFPVEQTEHLERLLPHSDFDVPTALHWHGDTYTLPPGSERILTRNPGCPEQGFIAGRNSHLIGVQCHFEMTAPGIDNLLQFGKADFEAPGPFISTPEEIRAGIPKYLAAANKWCETMLEVLIHKLPNPRK